MAGFGTSSAKKIISKIFMPVKPDDEQLRALSQETEIALQRARRLIEFMRAVYDNEAQILNASVKNAAAEPKEADMHRKRFRITTPVVALNRRGQKPEILPIPAGEIVAVEDLSNKDKDEAVEVEWNRRVLIMYVRDLINRAEQIAAPQR